MTDKHILCGHKPVPCDDLTEWAKWLETADRKVDRTNVGDVLISTVFLGLDRQFGEGKPILFETMIFGGQHDGYQTRCFTWKEAQAMHDKAVALVMNTNKEF